MDPKPSHLQEKRKQGTNSFPCTMYKADWYHYPEPQYFEVKPHWHDAFEIIHFGKGTFQVSVNLQQFEVKEETFFFLEGGEIHSILSHNCYEEQAILFERSILSMTGLGTAQKDLLDPLTSGQLSIPLCIKNGDPGFQEVRNIFRDMQMVFEANGQMELDQYLLYHSPFQLHVTADLLRLVASLAENNILVMKENRQEEPRIEALKKVIVYIRENYASHIYIRELADIMNMNEQYFCRLFKKTLGKTPVEYMNEIRIRQAVRLLETSSLSVVDIANDCGFGTVGHIISVFRKNTGFTPLAYRKMHLEAG